MALPAAAQASLAKLKQGPVQVTIDPSGGSEVEFFVRDGVDLSFVRGLEEAPVDLVGVYDLFSSGDSCEFELRLPESSLEVLNVIFGDHASGTSGGYSYRGFGNTAGQSIRSHALAVRFRPWQTRSSQANQVDVWLAVPSGDATKSMKATEPHTWVQPMRALPNITKPEGQLIARITEASR